MKFKLLKSKQNKYFYRMLFFNSKLLNLGLGLALSKELWYDKKEKLKSYYLFTLQYNNTEVGHMISVVLLWFNFKFLFCGAPK